VSVISHNFFSSEVTGVIFLYVEIVCCMFFKFIDAFFCCLCASFFFKLVVILVFLVSGFLAVNLIFPAVRVIHVCVCGCSSEFCEKHLSLLFTILDKSSNAVVRANAVIALGDLTFRFPNLIEPWTSHVYARFVVLSLIED